MSAKYQRKMKLWVFMHVLRFLMHFVFFFTLLPNHLNAYVYDAADVVYIWSLKGSKYLEQNVIPKRTKHANSRLQKDLTSLSGQVQLSNVTVTLLA